MSRSPSSPAAPVDLTRAELLRYGRHLVMPEVGLEGQRRLKASAVLIVGAGGLGSPLALYLVAAGVGRIGLVDFDRVDASNLQRQVLYGESVVGEPKVEAARRRLEDLNPTIRIEPHVERMSAANALDLVRGYDVVADGTDNFPTRYLVNDACALLGKPNVYGSIFRFDGQVSVFDAARGPCYRCLYPEAPPPGLVPSCAEGGVLGVLPGVIGALQGIETLKLLLGIGTPLIGRLLLFDALDLSFRELSVRKDPACPLCGEHPTIRTPEDVAAACAPPEVAGAEDWDLLPAELAARRAEVEVIDVREPHEARIAPFPGARLVPLATLPGRIHELDSSRTLVLLCHHGQRSRLALELLRRSGFTKLKNLRGGIDAWSREIDPTVPRY